MSVFDIKGNTGNYWNYSDSSKDNYSEIIEGTVVEWVYQQKFNSFTKQLECWPQGDPKMQFRMAIVDAAGNEFLWGFVDAKKNPAYQAVLKALDPDGTKDHVSLEEMLGKYVRLQTQAGEYGIGKPRPWWVTVLGDGQANLVRGMIDRSADALQAGQAAPAPAPAPVPAPAPAPAPAPQPAPTAFQVAQAAAQQAVAGQAPVPLTPQPQPQPQVPADAYAVYDEDILF